MSESLAIARQIAEALEEAHEKGIVHRDLKPQNIKASIEGKTKVLDFGLAKAMDPVVGPSGSASQLAASPTLTLGATVQGMILGTAAYMAPEQAKGMAVDKRADIWAFGVLLYEMLTGGRLFVGDSVPEVLAGVLKTEVDLSKLPAETPASLRTLLRRCLERSPKNRLHDIADARIVLQELIDGTGEAEAGSESSEAPAARRSPILVAAGVGTLLAIGVAAGWWFNARFTGLDPASVSANRDPMRFSIRPPEGVIYAVNPQISAAGDLITYQGWKRGNSAQLYSYRLAEGESRVVAGAEGVTSPFLSPDGRWVGYRKDDGLYKSPLAGGDRLAICPDCNVASGAAWLDDGNILYNDKWLGGLSIVSADGGVPRALTRPDAEAGERGHWFPNGLPGSRFALFTIFPAQTGLNDAWIGLLNLESGAYKRLLRGADAQFLPPRHLVFYRGGAYHAVEFDLDSGAVRGEPVQVLDGATEHNPAGTNSRPFAVGAGGLLVYRPGALHPPTELAWLRRGAAPEPLGHSARPWVELALSPDGRELIGSALEGGAFVLRRIDLESGREERLPLPGNNWVPVWRPDGSGIAFRTMRKGDFDTYWLDLVAGGAAQPLLESASDETPLAFTPDGSSLVAEVSLPDGSYPLVLHSIAGGESRVLVGPPFSPDGAAVSSDGRWLAFASSHSGVFEIYIQPLDGGGTVQRISRRGGSDPRWSPDGRWLYYEAGKKILRVAVRPAGSRLEVGDEETVVEASFEATSPFFGNGAERFLAALSPEIEPPTELRVIVNWQREIEAKLAQER